MNFPELPLQYALAVAVAPFAVFMLVRHLLSRRTSNQRPAPKSATLDTVTDWPPVSVRVMTINERQAYELVRRALPEYMVLAQVPLSRFIRVPLKHGYGEWLQRVGSMSADLLLCDSGSRVMSVIDIRAAQETDASRKRHERLQKVLKAAGIRVLTWREGELPSPAEVRSLFANAAGVGAARPLAGSAAAGAAALAATAASTAAASAGQRTAPLIPVAEMHELLAEGDAVHREALDPVPSGFFDELELVPAGR